MHKLILVSSISPSLGRTCIINLYRNNLPSSLASTTTIRISVLSGRANECLPKGPPRYLSSLSRGRLRGSQ
uniref:Uncharacterized protein n=2 Tax=Picea TaxID=3328 RepID=A0A117NJ18_PICGL|nr:hypothetical protein ABT39_MTgene699 [Picea glauca]QHR90224.1 hypothetical protein Q903MT_gene4247 [Picea sitchensis]